MTAILHVYMCSTNVCVNLSVEAENFITLRVSFCVTQNCLYFGNKNKQELNGTFQ